MARKKIISLAMATLLSVSSVWDASPAFYESVVTNAKAASQSEEQEVVAEVAEVNGTSEYGLCDNIQDGTILHCFDWKYTQIKEELPNIAAAGFTSVQTSPAQKGDGQVWYWLYQPQTFSVQPNALGNKAELQELCDEAKKYGINVIVDVVANHTRAIGDDGLGSDCYHNAGDAWYTNREGITMGRIGMPDLNSEHPTVQNKVKGYIEELKGIGVKGIRWDAAKHIALPSENCQFWPVVTSVGLYNYGEILVGPLESGGEGLMKEYTNYMSVTDSKYGQAIREAFEHGGVPSSIGNWSERGVSKNKLVYWGESHDTYSNNGEYGEATQLMDQNIIDRAYAIVAGQGKASSLYFSRPYSKDKQSIMAGQKGSTHFTSKEVAAVNHMHNACAGQKDYYVNGGNAAAVCRETGAVIVKGSGSGQVTIENGGGTTAPGTYIDEVSGSTWTVTKSTISGSVGESGIAVIYDAKKNASVSASKNSGNFTEAFELTLTPTNATKATYSINDGEAVEFTNATKVTIGENAQVGDKIIVKVTAEGEEGDPFSETFTYTMVDPADIPEAKAYVRVSKSSFTSAPKAYVYYTEGGKTKEPNGEWPGSAMTEDGDYYVYYTNDVDTFNVIFSYDGTQDPASQQPGYEVSGYMEYTKGKGVTAFTPTPKKTPTPKPVVTDTPAPVETAKPTPTPTQEVTKAPTEAPTAAPWVSVSVKDGEKFHTETLDVTITLNGATEGTYSVDNGPDKSFKSGDKVTVGQGKIADTDVTLKVTAIIDKATRTSTFTYKKVFTPGTASVKVSSVKKLQNLFEVVAEVAQTNAAAETGGMYATNPNGQIGKEATITIDGSFSDWSEDMLIAQGGAWDIANNWKGGHENCVLDDYALYAAWDDENLYVGWQMVNTTDTWANSGDGPLSDGGRVLDVPLMLAINVGNRPAMTGKMANGKLIWDALDIEFKTRVDNILLMSGKVGLGTPGYFIASDENGGASYDADYCLSFKTEGISYKMAEDSMPDKIMGLVDSKSPEDAYDASKYADMMGQGKGHSRTYDSFYEINIPLKTLGIDKSYIEQNGIGVMHLATRGTSAIDCLPHDPSMLDNATGDCAVDPSTSHEKDDTDVITVPLAAVGNANGNGGNSTVVTTPTKKPVTETTATPTEEVKETKAPSATPTIKPIATTVVETKAPTAEPTTESTVAPTTVPTIAPGECTVNFGADRSSPQYDSTALTLKAVGYGSREYKYEFSIDGKVVQESSEKDTYNWKGSAGTHIIKVVVTTKEGVKITSEKAYVIEQNPSVTPTVVPTAPPMDEEKPTATPVITATPIITATPVVTQTPTAAPQADPLNIVFKAKYKAPRKAGTKIPLTLTAEGGKAPYTYEIKVTNSAGKTVVLLSSQKKNTVNWTPSKAGTYTIVGEVTDAEGTKTFASGNYTISNPITVKTFKFSKSSVKKGKKVKITAKATSSDTVKYQFRLRKVGSKSYTTIRKYSKTGTFNWKANKKKGKYYIYLTVKDADGHKKSVKKKITIK